MIENFVKSLQEKDLSELNHLNSALIDESLDTRQPLDYREAVTRKIVAVNQRIIEMTDPTYQPPEQHIESLKSAGNRGAAESVQHTMDVSKKREAIAALEIKASQAVPGELRSIESQLQTARQELQAMEATHPYFERKAEKRRLSKEAEAKRVQAYSLMGSGDGELQRQGDQLLDESNKLFEQANQPEEV